MDTENWKDIPGYSNFQASDNGNIRSKNWHSIGRPQNLYPNKKKNGYLQVSINTNGKCVGTSVHRLVAMAWIPNPNRLPQVNHKNGDKTDNRPNNLEWVTAKANIRHAINVLKTRQFRIECIETGVIYESAQEASSKTGIDNSWICKAAKYGSRAGGLHWRRIGKES